MHIIHMYSHHKCAKSVNISVKSILVRQPTASSNSDSFFFQLFIVSFQLFRFSFPFPLFLLSFLFCSSNGRALEHDEERDK